MSKMIPLTQGRFALVDDNDYEWLNSYKWLAGQHDNTFYAERGIRKQGKKVIERMHRLILRLYPGDKQIVDHIDGNGLNNQRVNLRTCTASQSVQSRRKCRLGKSKYKGLSWEHRTRKWYSRIGINRKAIHLGSFDSEINAARAYDNAALKYFGQFALTNEMLGLLPKRNRPRKELQERIGVGV